METTLENSRLEETSGPKLSPRGRVRMAIELDEPLHRNLKVEAAKRGITMRQYISELLYERSGGELKK